MSAARRVGLALVIGAVATIVAHGYRVWSGRIEAPVQLNIEAPYHVALAVRSQNANPPVQHSYLPVMTLGRAQDRDIGWGASVPNRFGLYFYLSFPPLSFVVANAFLSALNLSGSPADFYLLNLTLGFITASILFLALSKLITAAGDSGGSVVLPAALVVAFALSGEYIQSFGVVYWAQELWMPIWLLQLLLLQEFLDDYRRGLAIALACVSFLSVLVEWTGFISNFAIGLLLLTRMIPSTAARCDRLTTYSASATGTLVLAATFAGALTLLIWDISQVDITTLIRYLFLRGSARSFGTSPLGWFQLPALAAFYIASMGPIILAAFTVAAMRLSTNPTWGRGTLIHEDGKARALVIITVTAASCVENLLLLQHAMEFSYDRLKTVVLFILLLGYLLASKISRGRQLAVSAALVLVSAIWLTTTQDVFYPIESPAWIRTNQEFARFLGQSPVPKTAVYASNGAVRGYLSALTGTNVLENQTPETLEREIRTRGATSGVFIVQESTSLPGAERAGNVLGDIRRAFRLRLGRDIAKVAALVELRSGQCLQLIASAHDPQFASFRGVLPAAVQAIVDDVTANRRYSDGDQIDLPAPISYAGARCVQLSTLAAPPH